MITDRRAFIAANTRLSAPPHTPELVLHLADEITPIWKLTEEELGAIGLPPPFWAFAWAGGQALARYLLDHPAEVAGRREAQGVIFGGSLLFPAGAEGSVFEIVGEDHRGMVGDALVGLECRSQARAVGEVTLRSDVGERAGILGNSSQ